MAWGSAVEIETRRRILVAAWAYAYEVDGVSLVDDATWDREASLIDLSINTTRPDLDKWFRDHFDPSTGMWVRNHPDQDGLRRTVDLLKRMADEGLKCA